MSKGKGSKDQQRNQNKKRDKGKKRNQKKKRGKGKKRDKKTQKPDRVASAPTAVAATKETAGGTLITIDPQAPGKSARVSDEPLPASEAVIREWGRRIEAEYRSAAITQHLTLWLIQIAASPDLIHDGLRIVTDELAHAQLSHEVFVDAGGTQPTPIARESLALRHNPKEPLEAAVTRHGVQTFCLGETVAVPLFTILRKDCVVPSARRALDRILKDEIRHRDFGWTLLDYLLTLPCASLVRDLVNQELPSMFAVIVRSYAPVGGEERTTITKAERGWGLMPIATYGQILQSTYEKDYQPRFKALGFDVDEAWQQATATTQGIGN